MGGWVGGWVEGWVDGWVGGWMDGWMGGWVGGWMESACNAGDLGSIPGWGRLPAEGSNYPLQCSCVENSVGRGAWQAAVHSTGSERVRHD
ncbi:hypothetical protein FD755_023304 [Muntiacus reevesi]|uniref:Uncharacterized protein n=1 Tax=Muntiacus reevesi TaxID=9886 RepID=A0A5N3VYH2_MUNRE|nr:hypothetical protein FD755_023304 [Muntiacus reevesi]